jgi:uncharacterized membrane protein YfcA
MALFENIQPLMLILIASIAFATAVFQSVSGFAGGLLLTVCLAPILGVKETIPIVATAMVVAHTTRLWVFRRWVRWDVFLAVFATALPGIVLGAVLYVRLPVAYVALALGGFLLTAVPLRRYLKSKNFEVGLNGLRLVGIPYGFVSGTIIGAGVMLAPFLLGAGIVGEQLVAVVAAIGVGLNVTKTAVFGFSPLLDATMAAKGVLIGLCTMPGAYTGRWIVTNTPLRIHTLLMEIFVLAGAGYFLWRAGRGFGWL